ncbi:MAG: phosphodiester glycosidase family protein, partial [Verrucomicrobiota bacterium]
RTFIATDWRGNWALGLTSSLSLHQLASLLDSSKTVTGWTVNRAINLDGGSSSALYFEEDSGLSISALNWKRVRNALGVSLK